MNVLSRHSPPDLPSACDPFFLPDTLALYQQKSNIKVTNELSMDLAFLGRGDGDGEEEHGEQVPTGHFCALVSILYNRQGVRCYLLGVPNKRRHT